MSKAVVLNQAPHTVIEKGLAVLGNLGVTPKDWGRNVVTNPITRARVASAMRGEMIEDTIMLEQLVKREIDLTRQVSEMACVTYPGDTVIEQAFKKAESVWGAITEHDRFVPAGLNRRPLLAACKGLDLKIYNNDQAPADCDGETLPTERGVIRLSFQTVMRPTDLQGRPFNLDMVDQIVWSNEQGGNGLTSAEETLYLFLRSIIETSLPLWGCGSVRCRNSSGSGSSLDVDWNADDGLDVDYWGRGYVNWDLGALPRKFLAVGN